MLTSDAEVGIGVAGAALPADHSALARFADEVGFDAITVFGDLMFQPPAMVLADMAVASHRIRLGIAAYNPWTQHPVEIAGQVAYLDNLSQGRAFYGLVRGAWLDQIGLTRPRAIDAITDTAAIVTALLAGDSSGYSGPVYQLEAGTRLLYDTHRDHVPLLIGSWSPRLARIAGRTADELQAGGSANPAMVERLSSLAAPGSPRICLNAVAVVDEDRTAALHAARTAAAPYFDVVAGLDPTVDLDPELLARIRVLCRTGDHEAAGALIPDDLLRRFAFAGTPHDLVEHALEIVAAGVGRVEFDTPFGLTMRGGLDLLGRRVLPALRAEIAAL